MILQFGIGLLFMAAGVWFGDWLWGLQTDHAPYLALMGAGYIVLGLILQSAKSIYRGLA